MKYRLIMVIVGLLFTDIAYSQKADIKSNLLYGATGTINLGVEVGLAERMTLDIATSFNLWEPKVSRERRFNHILIQPEFRYWLNQSFDGHFFGAHIHYAYYNFGGENWFLNSVSAMSNLSKSEFKNFHNRGWLAGAGFSYGYHWNFHKRWGLEATIGFGYAYMDYDKYNNPVCGTKIGNEKKSYFGPTKAGVTLIFVIN